MICGKSSINHDCSKLDKVVSNKHSNKMHTKLHIHTYSILESRCYPVRVKNDSFITN